jgi:polynucleotide 5'-hydroxyl-kinase GRC3/NOL9
MSLGWADEIAQEFLSQGLLKTGVCLILGGTDTGKTSLAAALAKRAASTERIGIIDADIGQSHIGPPATVGWAIVDGPEVDVTSVAPAGISFVGDVTPVGHLLQLTAAITGCTAEVSKAAKLIIIDTPGFINGSAAKALWWTVQRILQPELILAVENEDELSDIIAGLRSFEIRVERIKSPAEIAKKSPESRRNYRRRQFRKYFENSCVYNIRLSEVAVQPGRDSNQKSFVHRLVGLRDAKGRDIAMGLIADWQEEKDIAVIRAPEIDIQQVRCLVIGDVSVDFDEQ